MTFLITPTPTPDRLHGAYEINGQKYPRVSTILGVISKPGLEEWRQRVGPDEANRISNEAADHGTALHKILEDIDRGVLASGLSFTPFRPTINAYLAWRDANVDQVLMVEQTVFHARHKYAGTLDRLYLLNNGRRVVGDFKSGTSVDGTTRLQLAAYEEALEAMGHGTIDGRLVLHLPRIKPGYLEAIPLDREEQDRKAWRACLRLFRWNERHRRDWQTTRVQP